MHIFLKKITAAQNEITLGYHGVRGQHFLAVIFAAVNAISITIFEPEIVVIRNIKSWIRIPAIWLVTENFESIVLICESCFTLLLPTNQNTGFVILGNQSHRRVQDFMLRMTKISGSGIYMYIYIHINLPDMSQLPTSPFPKRGTSGPGNVFSTLCWQANRERRR